MTPLWYRLRAESRRRGRAWLALALLVGAVGATSIAAAAGARRTESAYGRFLAEQDAYDVTIGNYPADDGIAVFDLEEVASLPEVVDSARAFYEYSALPGGTPYTFSLDGRLGTELNRLRIIDGRMYEPTAVDEAVIGFDLADRRNLEVGDEIPLIESQYLTPRPGLPPEERRRLERFLQFLPEARVRVVGIEASPGEFPPQFGTGNPLIHLSPAFAPEFVRAIGDAGGEVLAVRLRNGEDAVPAFLTHLEELSGGQPFSPTVQTEQAASVQRSIHLQTVALWVFAGVVAAVGILVLAQLLARNAVLDSVDHAPLQAVGMLRRQFVALGVLRAVVIGGAAAVIAVIGAIFASPLAPIGLARVAEPDAGLSVDRSALAVGGLAVVVLTALLSVVPAWLVARRVAAPATARPTVGARVTARFRLSPVRATGTRMALEPGHGPFAVPVRSTIVAVAVGTATLTGVLVFGASLSHLLDTPELYGRSWDVEASDFQHAWSFGEVPADPRIEGAAVGDTGLPIEVGGEPSGALLFHVVHGSVGPPVLAGALPSAEDEIALGHRTARDLGVGVGDRVPVRVPPLQAVSMRVVGEVVLPSVTDRTGLGEGAVLDPSAGWVLAGQQGPPLSGTVYLDLAEGADVDAVLADVNREVGTALAPIARGEPNDIVNFGRVESLPRLLAGFVVLFTLATLANTLWVASHRRARELAVLRSLGFVRRQVRAAAAWQAGVLVLLALVIGLPTGIALGRWSWVLLADRIGVVAAPEVPMAVVAVAVPAAAVVAGLLLSSLPAPSRGHGRLADLLRSE